MELIFVGKDRRQICVCIKCHIDGNEVIFRLIGWLIRAHNLIKLFIYYIVQIHEAEY